MTVRPATADDLADVKRIADRAWHAAYGDVLPAVTIDRHVREWYDPAALTAVLSEGPAFLVATDDGAGATGGRRAGDRRPDADGSDRDVRTDDGVRADDDERTDDDRRVEADGWAVPADGEVVGFAMAGPSGDDWLLHSVYVDPSRWGEGHGSALVEAVLDRARAADADKLRVDEVLADNEVGRAFYRERFERVGSGRTELGGERYDTVAYVREL